MAPAGGGFSPASTITVTFTAAPARSVLPRLHRAVAGRWTISMRTAVFRPAYTPVTVTVPRASAGGAVTTVRLAGPVASLLRAQQIRRSRLGYLPVTFTAAASPLRTPVAENSAGFTPPPARTVHLAGRGAAAAARLAGLRGRPRP